MSYGDWNDEKTPRTAMGPVYFPSTADSQFVCKQCKAVVVVPSMTVLGPVQKAALAAYCCLDCFGPREVKSL